MVTIPVSMYQTVVTNIQNLNDAATGMPVTMSALTTAAEPTEEHAGDGGAQSAVVEHDGKTTAVLNGTQTQIEEESVA